MALGSYSIGVVRSAADRMLLDIRDIRADLDNLMNELKQRDAYQQFKNNTPRGQDIDNAFNTLNTLLSENLLPNCSNLVKQLYSFANEQERINQ